MCQEPKRAWLKPITFLVMLVTAFSCVSNTATGQTSNQRPQSLSQLIPGPAAGGWYAQIIAVTLESKYAGSTQCPSNNLQFCTFCLGVIVDADHKSYLSPDPDFILPARITKTLGPFGSKLEAREQFERAGWTAIAGLYRTDPKWCWTPEMLAALKLKVEEYEAKPKADDEQKARKQPVPPPAPERPKPSVDNLVDSILENKGSRTRATPMVPSAPNLSSVVTASEVEAVRQKIRPCWQIPKGVAQDASLVVALVVQLKPDGRPTSAEITDQDRYNRDPLFRVAADAARRAVLHPNCQPWPLAPEKYFAWRTTTLSFDPKNY